MGDRCVFIQDDIDCQRIDDFMVLPSGNYFDAPYARHVVCFLFTH